MEPLRIKAIHLASGAPTSRSVPSEPDIAALVERFDEPLRGEIAASRPATAEPTVGPRADSVPGPRAKTPQPSVQEPPAHPGLSRNALVSALVVLSLIPLAILFVQLWHDIVRHQANKAEPPAQEVGATETVYEKKDTSRLEAETNAGNQTAPPAALDVTGSLSHGAAGWSIEPDVAGELPFLMLAAQTVASEPQTAASKAQIGTSDGTSEMGVVPSPTATAEQPDSAAAAPPPPRKPTPPAETAPPVRTVKVVAVQPPGEKKPYGGAYALGAPAEKPAAPAEWMVTKTAVDMHAKAKQSSETVKVAQGGIKVRVTGRHRNWIQVQDPKSSTTGWIYNRFLKPSEPPAQ